MATDTTAILTDVEAFVIDTEAVMADLGAKDYSKALTDGITAFQDGSKVAADIIAILAGKTLTVAKMGVSTGDLKGMCNSLKVLVTSAKSTTVTAIPWGTLLSIVVAILQALAPLLKPVPAS